MLVLLRLILILALATLLPILVLAILLLIVPLIVPVLVLVSLILVLLTPIELEFRRLALLWRLCWRTIAPKADAQRVLAVLADAAGDLAQQPTFAYIADGDAIGELCEVLNDLFLAPAAAKIVADDRVE